MKDFDLSILGFLLGWCIAEIIRITPWGWALLALSFILIGISGYIAYKKRKSIYG
jgi:uncharacterized membrane protein